jgi:hypothetical protein
LEITDRKYFAIANLPATLLLTRKDLNFEYKLFKIRVPSLSLHSVVPVFRAHISTGFSGGCSLPDSQEKKAVVFDKYPKLYIRLNKARSTIYLTRLQRLARVRMAKCAFCTHDNCVTVSLFLGHFNF